jgi:hypothetical protein
MNRYVDAERILDAFLAPEDDQLADGVIDAALTEIARTPQRRALRVPWRFPNVSPVVRIALVAVALVAVVGGGAILISGTAVVPRPSPTPANPATETPTPSQSVPASTSPAINPLDARDWTTYTSSQYGFTIGHPSDWLVDPATRAWAFDSDAGDTQPHSPGADHLTSPDRQVRVSAWSVPLDGVPIDTESAFQAWIEAYCDRTANTPCTGIAERAVPLCLERRDCHYALLVPFRDDVQAFFSGGIYDADAMTVVAVWRGSTDPQTGRYGGSQALLQRFLATMQVFPNPPPTSIP